MQLLWHRFEALGPDVQGCLNRSVFQRPPYNEDIFCRQVEAFTCGKVAKWHVFSQPQYVYNPNCVFLYCTALVYMPSACIPLTQDSISQVVTCTIDTIL